MSSTADEFLLHKIGGYSLCGQTLGKGAFARVELAIHRITNSQVALKIINLNHVDEAYVRKNILRESAILKNLRHENIVRLYETLAYKNTYCFVMEYLEGGNLLAYIQEQKQKKLIEKTARKYFNQLLLAIRYLHDHGIIHRDLKLQNIMLTDSQSKVKLVDFGLSNFFNKDNLLKTQCGSAEYAAPELFDKGVEYGASVELWSVGVVLYGMATGRMPFEVKPPETKENLVMQIRRGLNVTHEHTLKKLSPGLKDLLIKTLEPDTGKRITLNNMFVHGWVVEDGRKPLLKSPPHTLPHDIRQRVIDQVAQLYQKPVGKTMELIRMNEDHSMVATYKILMDQARRAIQATKRTHSAPSKYFRSMGSKRADTATAARPISARPERRSISTLDNKKDSKFHAVNYVNECLSARRTAETKATDTLPIASLLQVSKKVPAIDKSPKPKASYDLLSENELNQTPFRLSPAPERKNNTYKTPNERRKLNSEISMGESSCSEGVKNSAKKGERRWKNSNMIEATTEGEFELSDSRPGDCGQTRQTVDIVSDKVKVSFCGKNLKRGSFKVTEWKKHDNNTRIRVHIPSKRDSPSKPHKRHTRSISPNNARQMLHRNTFPLQRQEMDIGYLKADDDVNQVRDDDSFNFHPTQSSQLYMHDERGGRLSPERIPSPQKERSGRNSSTGGRKSPVVQNWDFNQPQMKMKSPKATPIRHQDDNIRGQTNLSRSICRKIFGSNKKESK